jgi:WD40 repeat protein
VCGDETPAETAPKITYDDQVRPILRQHCFTCHNQNDAKGGLALDNYARAIEGGSSGEVVVAEDLESSRLWALITHEEEPYMPPAQPQLPEDQLALIRQWIEGGLLQNAGASAKAKKKSVQLAAPTAGGGRPEGPVAMPEQLRHEPMVLTARAAAVSALAGSPWAPLVAVAGQQQVVLYHADTARLLGILPFPEGIPHVLRFSRDGALLLVAGGHGARLGIAALYDVKTGQRLATVGDELDVVLAADISPDLTRIALGGPQRIVRVYATESGDLVHEIRKHTDWIYSVAYSPDGVLLATADRSNGLFVWEADTAREYLDLRGHTDAVTDLAWRSDGNVLASSSLDGSVRLWEMNEGREVGRISAHGGGVQSLAFAWDGRLATAGRDRVAKLWDAELKPLQTFPEFPEPALKVALASDGQRVVAGDWSGDVRMWKSDTAEQIATLAPNPPPLTLQIAQHQAAIQQARSDLETAQSALATARTPEASAESLAAPQAAVDAAQAKLAALEAELAEREAELAKMTNSGS